MKLTLKVLENKFGVYRLRPEEAIPQGVFKSQWYCITKTDEELSLVCEEGFINETIKSELGWKCLKVLGPLEFQQIGILAGISEVLAREGISIFVVSTFDTDYIMVKEELIEETCKALSDNGYGIC